MWNTLNIRIFEYNEKQEIMLRIGKADLYFTLWDVSSNKEYGTDLRGNSYLQYIHTNYHYRQNLSMDESKAIEKAKGFGVTDLEPDEDLRGRYSSWKRTKTFDEPIVENVFTFGKYSGGLFNDNDDVDYLKWYYYNDSFVSPESKITMRNRIVDLSDDFCVYEDELITVEQMENITKREERTKFIKKNGYIDVFVDRNVDGYDGSLTADGLNFYFENTKENWYNGHPYYLPMLKGKGKRIKNKNVRMFVNGERREEEWKVTNFEILKK